MLYAWDGKHSVGKRQTERGFFARAKGRGATTRSLPYRVAADAQTDSCSGDQTSYQSRETRKDMQNMHPFLFWGAAKSLHGLFHFGSSNAR